VRFLADRIFEGGEVMNSGRELSDPESRVVGLKQVLRHAKQRELVKVYIAKDADEDIVQKLVGVCEEGGIPYDTTLTMHQIGNACSIEVGSACAGVLKTKK
jgi:large subunit ribosomal protein L7A